MTHFSFSLAKELGMTQRELMDRMSTDEFYNWYAYYILEDDKHKEKLDKEVKLERSAKKTDQQRADDIVKMFKTMAGANGSNSRPSN